MKRLQSYLFLVLVLIFSLQSLTWADDIRDLEIEGMSIGNSLLNFYSKNEIKQSIKNYYPKSKKYYDLAIFLKKTNYDAMSFVILNKDKNYLIQSLEGRIIFEDINDCLKKKDLIVNDIKKNITIINRTDHEKNYPQYVNSKAIISELDVNGGRVRVWCDDMSIEMKEQGIAPGLAVAISPHEFLVWLNLEAY